MHVLGKLQYWLQLWMLWTSEYSCIYQVVIWTPIYLHHYRVLLVSLGVFWRKPLQNGSWKRRIRTDSDTHGLGHTQLSLKYTFAFIQQFIPTAVNNAVFASKLVSRRPTLKKGSRETVYKKFSVRNFDWMTFTGYVSVMPTSIQPDTLEVIKVWWYYFISTVLNPTNRNDWVLYPFFATVLAINVPEVISTSRDSFDRPMWHHQIWSDWSCANSCSAKLFLHSFTRPLFEGQAPRD